ncbi:MAG: hypothetical protein LBL52_04310 [Rickettsiales bacterium]|jgi:hypothetical protein|nr:hypothetical protein [Rickettsiales bacterium]
MSKTHAEYIHYRKILSNMPKMVWTSIIKHQQGTFAALAATDLYDEYCENSGKRLYEVVLAKRANTQEYA